MIVSIAVIAITVIRNNCQKAMGSIFVLFLSVDLIEVPGRFLE